MILSEMCSSELYLKTYIGGKLINNKKFVLNRVKKKLKTLQCWKKQD